MSRKKQPAGDNHERWLVSYADFITLLFGFFVVMFASSQADKNRAKQVSESIREALEKGQFGGAVAGLLGRTLNARPVEQRPPKPNINPVELTPSLEALTRGLEIEIKAGKLRVTLETRGLVVSLREAAFFASGDDRIYSDTYPILGKIADSIRKIPNAVRLEGHSDSIPIHNSRFQNNWELSAARGIAMLQLLQQRFAIPMSRMAVAGYAETVLVDSNDTEEGRARNRRVDIVILNQQGERSEPTPQTK